jgi:hypothetical protein
MSEDSGKPKLELVPKRDPVDVFNDLSALRKRTASYPQIQVLN